MCYTLAVRFVVASLYDESVMSLNFSYPGAIHIHTIYSDGSGSFPEVVTAAREAGLRWIIVTDHDTLAGKRFEGWHDDLLVIVGHEITPDRNHFLALNVDQVVDNRQAPQDYIDEVYGRGGFGVIAHPDERVKNDFKDVYRWDDWTIDGPRDRQNRVVGLELWNIMSDWGEHLTPANKYLNFFIPRLGLSGPTPATLAWWDRLNMAGRRTFGIGGVDVHAFKIRVPWGIVEVFPYRWMFGALTNYVLFDTPFAADPVQARNQVFGALTQGRSYFVNRLDGDAPSIVFIARRNQERWSVGDSPSLAAGPLTFVADVGCNAHIQLIRDGQVAVSAIRAIRHSIAQPGVYRLEGYLGGRPWLYTNPIYVQA